jgi:hypothetical protein
MQNALRMLSCLTALQPAPQLGSLVVLTEPQVNALTLKGFNNQHISAFTAPFMK